MLYVFTRRRTLSRNRVSLLLPAAITPAAALDPVRRPLPPLNVTARYRHGDGAVVSWQPPPYDPSAPPARRYVIEWRTVGQWVRLADQLDATSFHWKTASRGTTYQFRVRSKADDEDDDETGGDNDVIGVASSKLDLSLPSDIAILDTTGRLVGRLLLQLDRLDISA